MLSTLTQLTPALVRTLIQLVFDKLEHPDQIILVAVEHVNAIDLQKTRQPSVGRSRRRCGRLGERHGGKPEAGGRELRGRNNARRLRIVCLRIIRKISERNSWRRRQDGTRDVSGKRPLTDLAAVTRRAKEEQPQTVEHHDDRAALMRRHAQRQRAPRRTSY